MYVHMKVVGHLGVFQDLISMISSSKEYSITRFGVSATNQCIITKLKA